MNKDFLKKKIESIANLPTLPDSIERIIKMIDSPKGVSVAVLGNIISNDPAISARILKVANSPYYGFRKEISTIGRAIMIIGLNETKSIILTSTILKLFKMDGSDFDIYKFWEYSIATAIVTKYLSKIYHYPVSGAAFMSGLLHQIGVIILYQYFNPFFVKVLEQFKGDKSTTRLKELEREIVGATHNEVGAYLLEKWNMPSHIIEVVKYCDNPILAETDKELIIFVHLARYIVLKLKIGSTLDYVPSLNEEIWDMFSKSLISISKHDLDSLIVQSKEEIERADSLISILKSR